MQAATTPAIAQDLVEQWMGLARSMKNTMVTAINTGFDLWEHQSRRLAGMLALPPAAAPWNGLAARWIEQSRQQMEIARRVVDDLWGPWTTLSR